MSTSPSSPPANAIATERGENGLPKVVVTAADGARVEMYLHGAHVTSWHPAGSADDRLYVSPLSPFAPGIPIRGGVPVCFPQFADQGALPMHGFARDAAWTAVAAGRASDGAAEIRMRLVDTPATRALWPHAFACDLVARAQANTLTIALAIANTGAETFTLTAALHTYLRVGDVRQTRIEGLAGAHYRDKRQRLDHLVETAPALALTDPLDRVYYVVPDDLVVREPARSLAVHAEGSTDTVVWNPGAPTGNGPHDMPADGYVSMLCVEAAIARAPLAVAPGATHRLAQSLTAA